MELNNNQLSIGTFIIARLNPTKGCFIFATDSRVSRVNTVTQELKIIYDNVRKFQVFYPFVVLFSGDGVTAKQVLNDVMDQFKEKTPLMLQEFEACVTYSIHKMAKVPDEWANSFILGSVRIVNNSFDDKYLVLIKRLQDPVHVLACAIGDGMNEMSPQENIDWNDINQVQNDIIENFARVYYGSESCGGPIEMMTLSLQKKKGSKVKVLDEDHILQLPEQLCDGRGIAYKVPDKFYECDMRGKFLRDEHGECIKKQNARINSRGYRQNPEILLKYRNIFSYGEKKPVTIEVNLDEKLFVEKA